LKSLNFLSQVNVVELKIIWLWTCVLSCQGEVKEILFLSLQYSPSRVMIINSWLSTEERQELNMELDWITPLQASEKWGITERQVQSLCLQGKISGAVRLSKLWLIPKDAPKPVDGRTKAAKATKEKYDG
jgi:hypothetical protein